MKSIKFLAAALFATTFAVAQNEADNTTDKTVSFGVKGGVNFATISGDDFDSPDSRTSFHVGGVVEMPISNMFSLQGEVLYSGKGFEFDFEGVDDQKVEYQLDYLDVPILAKVYVVKGLSIEAGPQFSFLLNEEIDYDPTGDDGDIEFDENAESFDFGIAAGLSFQTEFGLFATGRYVYGLTDIYPDVDAHNQVFQISLGYKF